MGSMHGPGIEHMLEDIQEETRYTRQHIGKDTLDRRVMDAMAKVPRDVFIPDSLKTAAFDNTPLSIGHGQTISQPFIVALMTDLVAPLSHHRILEIGTGSGYQTALLAALCDQVYSVDLISELTQSADERLATLGYDNIRLKTDNGYEGWSEYAPYDGILVTAAAPRIPDALIEQLVPGGRLVIPVGQPNTRQELVLLQKDNDGGIHLRNVLGVAFVPLVNKPVYG